MGTNYRRVFLKGSQRWVYKFDIHKPRWGRLRDTLEDTGQSKVELAAHAAALLVELQNRAKEKKSAGSLTFKTYVEYYKETRRSSAPIHSSVDILCRQFGDYPMGPKLEDAFHAWIEEQSTRTVQGTGRTLSPATIQQYQRYFKAVCRNALRAPRHMRLSPDDDPSVAIRIGKGKRRCYHIAPDARKRALEVIESEYPDYMPALLFARTVPIRPRDQWDLRWDMIDEVHNQIPYLPQKTNPRDSNGSLIHEPKWAYPPILPHMREYIIGRIGDQECPYIFYAHDRRGRRIQITRMFEHWARMRLEFDAPRMQFYDWRHDAVNYLLSLGFSKDDIKRFAGWSTDDMVEWYDTNDRIRFAQRTQSIMASAMSQFGQIVGAQTGTGAAI